MVSSAFGLIHETKDRHPGRPPTGAVQPPKMRGILGTEDLGKTSYCALVY